MVNRVTLIGRIGKQPELKQFGDKTLTKFSFATSESFKDKSGEWQDKTQWHTISYWNTLKAEKGDMLFIEGKIEYREHEGKYYTDIIASYCRKINANGSVNNQHQQTATVTETVNNNNNNDLGDLPF